MQNKFNMVIIMKSVMFCIFVFTVNDLILAQIWYSASRRYSSPVYISQNPFITKTLVSDLDNVSVFMPVMGNTKNKLSEQMGNRELAKDGKNQTPMNPTQPILQAPISDFVPHTDNLKLYNKSRMRLDGLPIFEKKTRLNSRIDNRRLPKLPSHRASCKNGIKCGVRKVKIPRRHAENVTKKSKFLEIFQVVNFDNTLCVASNGLGGMCFHQYECEGVGGAAMGDCADGFGSCCVVQFTCGAQTALASGWFTNPGFPAPSADRLSCALALDKSSDDVLQIRLDFLYFELQPGTDGSCDNDQFMVSGHNSNSLVPLLCGLNNGQHMYVEVGDVPGPIYLSIQTITDASRLFAIKVSQLTASDDLAPTGCLQYYTNPNGVIESFNYQDKSTLAVYRNPTYINNMNYAMCVKRAKEQCSITYSNTDAAGDEAQFQILNFDTDGLPLIPPAQAGVEIYSCPDDFLALGGERLCGDKFNDGSVLQDFALNAPVTEVTAGPIVLYFKSDSSMVGRGFRLFYNQNPCTAD